MDRGVWQAIVHGVTESDTTDQDFPLSRTPEPSHATHTPVPVKCLFILQDYSNTSASAKLITLRGSCALTLSCLPLSSP